MVDFCCAALEGFGATRLGTGPVVEDGCAWIVMARPWGQRGVPVHRSTVRCPSQRR
ncbi:MAG: hypothetical protein KatS3mg010_1090 [Acidimicrobiia bacterium]|nr:MAG: hypothetical protein KatS3mg010_1090 [Acidimicrobiia bacterium]